MGYVTGFVVHQFAEDCRKWSSQTLLTVDMHLTVVFHQIIKTFQYTPNALIDHVNISEGQ